MSWIDHPLNGIEAHCMSLVELMPFFTSIIIL